MDIQSESSSESLRKKSSKWGTSRDSDDSDTFRLDHTFLDTYIGTQPKWGPLGYVVYKRTYARDLKTISKRHYDLAVLAGLLTSEEWWLTVCRVVEGTYAIQQHHCQQIHIPWSAAKAQRSAQEMYRLIFNFKFLPPGRGLWMMGSEYVQKAGGASLNNCGFTSTSELNTAFSAPFTFLMDMSMLGVGVGFDTQGAGLVALQQPEVSLEPHVVEDTREGWVALVRRCLDAYVGVGTWPLDIDCSNVRPEGAMIKGFGGTASGPGPLIQLYANLKALLDRYIGKKVTSTLIVDINNLIGKCVVSGNVRRSAEIAFGSADDKDFLELKDYTKYPKECAEWRWASNNSVMSKVGMNYADVAKRTALNGEPGFNWLENARNYGRMGRNPDYSDQRVQGANPCVEQSLESFELCCLVETFPSLHRDYEEYERTLKFAYLYAKTVTLVSTHDPRTNAVLLRNRRIGCSQSGIVANINKVGLRTHMDWCDNGYSALRERDEQYSNWLCVPRSVKMTSVKPSGTVSNLPGVPPGIHHPHSQYYFRVIRMAPSSPLWPKYKAAGYNCVDLRPSRPEIAVYFAVKEEHFVRGKDDVSMFEQLEIAAQLQTYWADNQVSVTVTFNKDEAKDIKHALELYEVRLKGVSFLPVSDHGYEHAPYQAITEEQYDEYVSSLRLVDLSDATNEVVDKFCDGEACQVSFESD